jgi:hypothetical protein
MNACGSRFADRAGGVADPAAGVDRRRVCRRIASKADGPVKSEAGEDPAQ